MKLERSVSCCERYVWLIRTNQPGIIVISRTEFGQPIFFIDPDYRIKKCSKRVKSILEHAGESELVGQKCHQLFFQLDSPCRLCPVSRSIVMKTMVEQEIQRDSFNGRSSTRLAVATPIQDSNGRVQHIIMDCLGTDYSLPPKKENVEPMPAAHKSKVGRPFPSSQSVLLDRDMAIILYSPSVKSVLSQESVDLIGHNLFTVSSYFNRPIIRNRLEDFIFNDDKAITVFETDDKIYGGNRTKHVIEKLSGHGYGDAILLRSTTVEKERDESKKILKEQLKLSSEFASRMAHDVKNALALISTNADFIYSEAPDTDMTGQRNDIAKYAEIIQKHVKQIVNIVEYANSLKLHNWDTIAESDLAQLLNRVVTITQLSKPYVNHNVSLKNGENLPRIVTSELYLERALTELVKSLLMNAEDNSELYIELSHEPAHDFFILILTCRQQTDILSDIETKLQQFYVSKKQWDPEILGMLIAYSAVLIQDGSMESELLDNGEFRLILKLPRTPHVSNL